MRKVLQVGAVVVVGAVWFAPPGVLLNVVAASPTVGEAALVRATTGWWPPTRVNFTDWWPI